MHPFIVLAKRNVKKDGTAIFLTEEIEKGGGLTIQSPRLIITLIPWFNKTGTDSSAIICLAITGPQESFAI